MFDIQITPVVTEKSTSNNVDRKQYHFYISANANKIELKRQLEKMYGKKVDKISIKNNKAKKRSLGRKEIVKRKERKEAIVTFKDKATIDINKIK